MKIYSYPSDAAETKLRSITGRGTAFKKKDVAAVTKIIADVRKNGDRALIAYTRRFDAPDMQVEDLAVTSAEMAAARKAVSGPFLRALERAAGQIETYHNHQVRSSWISTDRPGTVTGQLIRPVETAGIYVPGGKGGNTPLVSTVLMCAIPARIAGVGEVVMVTPPKADGTVSPHLLVAAEKAGVDTVYRAGSAWAVAALAHGTETIPRADVIAGPGNIYVTIAKSLVAGAVGIDMVAGPSEILIVADDSANPEYVAADLLSQAEHDPLASSLLVTSDSGLARTVQTALSRQMEHLSRKDIAAESVRKYGAIFVVTDLETAFGLSNRIAPEHLELHIASPFAHLGRIRNAGAVFLGEYTPEPVGDYVAGPNHVLPTAGTARFFSALSVDHFTKRTSLIHYSKDAFDAEAEDVVELAAAEGLDAHAGAVKIRMGRHGTA